MLKVVLDAGHGGIDSGTTNNGIKESDINLDTALRVGRYLEKCNIEVIYTRKIDKAISLEERTQIANKNNADVFISFHRNSYKASNVAGIETYYFNNSIKGKELATILHQKQKNAFLSENRGIKEDSLYVLKHTKMVAVLLETGFISNQQDLKRMLNIYIQDDLAKEIAIGICSYLKIPFVEDDKYLYKVQIGAFKNYEDAQKIKEELLIKGYKSYIVKENI